MNPDLKIKSIKNKLIDQVFQRDQLQKSLSEQQQLIDQHKADIEITDDLITSLHRMLEDMGEMTDPTELTKKVLTNESQEIKKPVLSEDYTLKLIEDCTDPNGYTAVDIIDLYDDLGISTYPKQILRQFENLLDKCVIYCINPDAKRKRRYRVVESNED